MNERDSRLIAAAEDQARSTWAIAEAVTAAEESRRTHEERRSVQAYRQPFRLLFGGERGALVFLRAIPGFGELWVKEVPAAYVFETRDRAGRRWSIVLCPCGARPALQAGGLGECDCHRWFFSTGRSVRVRTFDIPEVVA